MLNLKEGEIVRSLQDGSVFEVKKVAGDFVILDAVDGSRQVMAGKRWLDFLFGRTAPVLPVPEIAPGPVLEG